MSKAGAAGRGSRPCSWGRGSSSSLGQRRKRNSAKPEALGAGTAILKDLEAVPLLADFHLEPFRTPLTANPF